MVWWAIPAVEKFLGRDGFELAVIGAIAGVLALVVAVWQLMRTARSLRAASGAIRATQESLAVNQLLTLIPRLQQIETELDASAHKNDPRGAEGCLVQWRNTAGEVAGVLSGRENVHDLTTKLRDAMIKASLAKRRLIESSPADGSGLSAAKATKPVRGAIAESQEALNVYFGQLKTYAVGKP